MKKAIVMFSGGLDSMLVSKILQREGFSVLALNFSTGLEISKFKHKYFGEEPAKSVEKTAQELGLDFREIDISAGYLDVVMNPKYGYGSAINPCTDCHIYMLKHAKRIMEDEGYAFIATGEVLGQRPNSQNYHQLMNVSADSGLEGYLLRPLSAKLLPPTIPETEGLINRENLYSVQGRSRTVQEELAKAFGLKDYPTPAGGGCYIVDKSYAKRFYNYIRYKAKGELSLEDMKLLAFGRHFRISPQAFLTMGRELRENELLPSFRRDGMILLEPQYRRGPAGLLELTEGLSTEERQRYTQEAAKLIVLYSKEESELLEIKVSDDDGNHSIYLRYADCESAKQYENVN